MFFNHSLSLDFDFDFESDPDFRFFFLSFLDCAVRSSWESLLLFDLLPPLLPPVLGAPPDR